MVNDKLWDRVKDADLTHHGEQCGNDQYWWGKTLGLNGSLKGYEKGQRVTPPPDYLSLQVLTSAFEWHKDAILTGAAVDNVTVTSVNANAGCGADE